MANRLKHEKSPYLLQHGENPVDWYPWCDEAFQAAAAEDRPVFLSIGYSTCHWCHVMAHESFEDEQVAALLNRHFICIKVDREERPDIDAVYMSVCQAMTGTGGWPLTILMTAKQRPFFAGTYFPKQGRYGQPGLLELLERVIFLWNNQREQLLEASDQITAVMRRQPAAFRRNPDLRLLQKAYRFLSQSFDCRWGGFGEAPKFPTPHNLLFLMLYGAQERQPEALDMAERTLEAMARGGICDQVGGGFSRYSTDEKWLVPHFEKMLYDNALLILAYLRAYQLTQKEAYADTARRTADYILQELTSDAGGFFCGQDADSDGTEGKYYVFTPREVIDVLGPQDGAEFCRLYGITEAGNFEGSSIPNRVESGGDAWRGDDPRLQKLQAYRKSRTALHRDDKILLSWNGWAIIALAQAGLILKEARYLNTARKAQQFIEASMTDAEDRLFLRFRDGEAAIPGQLEDYGVYALALLALYRATFAPDFLALAIHRARQMIDLFEDREQGGCFISAYDAEQLITRPKETYDGAMPSGNSVAAALLEALAALTGETFWREAADRQLRFLAGQAAELPAGHCFGLLVMADRLYPHRELICAGSRVPDELWDYLRSHPADDLSILFLSKDNAKALADCAPFTASYPIPEEGTVWYLCENGACQAPVREFGALPL
ncbi:MAG: thioredoxin domain-containing protein [Candidatus Onthomonas sp.]